MGVSRERLRRRHFDHAAAVAVRRKDVKTSLCGDKEEAVGRRDVRAQRLERVHGAPALVQHAHVGLTPTTGQLADNHDVLSLELNDDWDEHFEMEAALKNAPKFKSQPELGVSEERMDR